MSFCIDYFYKFRHILEVRCEKYPYDFFDSLRLEHSGTFICCRSRGYDVIDDNYNFLRKIMIPHSKAIFLIFKSFFTREF